MTAGRRCSSTKTPWPAAAATSARTTPTPWPPPATWPSACARPGEYQAARELGEDTLARRRRVLGEDHPDTLASADGLAISLRAVGGHPGTLTSASSLATSIGHRGEHQAARELAEDTLARRRRVLGEDHPDTLASANGLAISLRAVGEHQAARELDEDTLARRRRVLGEDHPDTLASADNLAFSLQGVRGRRRPGSWAKTPWPAAAASWARTTPTPWPPPTTSS